MFQVTVVVAICPTESWICAMNERSLLTGNIQLSESLAVPETTPVEGSSERPFGKFVALQVYGGTPPEACKVSETKAPVVVSGKEVVVILTDGGT